MPVVPLVTRDARSLATAPVNPNPGHVCVQCVDRLATVWVATTDALPSAYCWEHGAVVLAEEMHEAVKEQIAAVTGWKEKNDGD